MFQIKVVEEIKTRILVSVNFFLIVSFVRTWKNAAEVERPQMAM
jgi:hypothetical protein